MSVQSIKGKNGTSYRVVWRDYQGNRESRTFPAEKAAKDFDAHVKTLKAKGELHLLFGGIGGSTLLADYAVKYIERMKLGQLRKSTLTNYSVALDSYVMNEDYGIGHRTMRELELNGVFFRELRDEMTKAGVGYHLRKRTFTMLSAIFREAVEDGYCDRNPVRGLKVYMTDAERKKSAEAEKKRLALSPLQVEQLRKQLNSRYGTQRDPLLALRDAVLVGLIGNEGLRPGEALFLRWNHLAERLHIEGSVSLGEENIGGKTNTKRSIKIQKATREDLQAFRLACGSPDDDKLIFPDAEGGYWSEDTYRYWRRASYKRAIRDLAKRNKAWEKYAASRPYDLRMSAASMRIRAGEPLTDIAKHMGHSIETLMRHYAQVIESMEGKKPVPLAKAIADARKKVWGAAKGKDSLPPLGVVEQPEPETIQADIEEALQKVKARSRQRKAA